MAYDESADLIGSSEATLDTLGLLVGDTSSFCVRWMAGEWKREGTLTPIGDITIASLVRRMAAHDSMHAAQVVRRLSGRPE